MTTFHKKKFIAAAEAYLQKEWLKWIDHIQSSKLDEAAITYGIREGWLLPNEGLEAVTTLNLFPQADVIARANAVHLGAFDITELEAKKAIAAAVKSGIAEAEAGIQAIAGTLTGGKEHEAKNPPPVVPVASVEPALGIPEGLASLSIRLHVFHVEQMEFYTADRAIADYIHAAQVQAVRVKVVWAGGEHGNKALSVKMA